MRGVHGGDVRLGALVLAGIVLVAFLTRAPQTPGLDTFSSTDFRSGGYAAWFTLLQRESVNVQRFERRPAELDATIDTLIAASPLGSTGSDVRRPADVAALNAWVAAGGRLISLGAGGRDRRTASGRGEVDDVADARRFDNALLAQGDNARLAFALARPRRSGGIVAFDEALHGLLVERAWWQAIDVPLRVALGGVALAVLIALGGSALRLGPPVTLRVAREPASDEFVAAVAALYERARARRAAIGLLAAGARNAGGEAAAQLRALAERPAPNDRDLITSAELARTIREAT